MILHVVCPSCSTRLRVPAHAATARSECPKCGKKFVVRARDADTEDSLYEDRARIGPLAHLRNWLHAYFAGRRLKKWLLNRRAECDRYYRALAQWQIEHDDLQKEIRFALDKPIAPDGTSDLVPIMPH